MRIDYRLRIGEVLNAAEAEQRRIMSNTELSAAGKKTAIDKAIPPLHAQARALGALWVKDTRRQAEQAQAAYNDGLRRQDSAVNHARRQYYIETARELVDYSAWETVSGAILATIDTGDADRLHAWQALEGRLRAKFDAGIGPQSDAGTGIFTTLERLQDAVKATEPAELAELRATQTTAAEAHQRALDVLGTVDFERRLKNSAPLFVDITHPVEQVAYTSENGLSGYFTRTGGDSI